MGLDLSINRIAAIEAGLQLSIQRNGTDVSIQVAKEHNDDPDFIKWLETYIEVVHIPGTVLIVENTGTGDDIVIRANQWGRVYGPMTEWLKANNITWGEF